MTPTPDAFAAVTDAVRSDRLVHLARELIAVPSRTGEAGAAADRLAELLAAEGLPVERHAAGHPAAPAVVVRLDSGRPGRTLQFDSHLDTVHLPFVPPTLDGDRLTGSGSADMKAGLAASVEALLALRDQGGPPAGSVLLTAHDLHEAPWGDGSQLNALIRAGHVGDAVLIPEYLNHCIPVIGRGSLVWKAAVRRRGPAVHEVMRPDEPSVIAAAAELVLRLTALDRDLAARRDPRAGPESVFIGQVHAGEIYNQYPQECRLEGTRRWLPGTTLDDVTRQLRDLFARLAHDTGTTVDASQMPIRDAFLLDPSAPFVHVFQSCHERLTGRTLPLGAKPFCDDANSFWSLAGVPAITHGPEAGGAHTLQEWVSVADLVRVARLYALTALTYCVPPAPRETP